MKNRVKGGIETIIAVIILVGIVVALIISAVLPTVVGGNNLADDAVDRLKALDDTIKPI